MRSLVWNALLTATRTPQLGRSPMEPAPSWKGLRQTGDWVGGTDEPCSLHGQGRDPDPPARPWAGIPGRAEQALEDPRHPLAGRDRPGLVRAGDRPAGRREDGHAADDVQPRVLQAGGERLPEAASLSRRLKHAA